MKNNLHIGISIGLRSEDESLWVNGIKQNALALARTLKASSQNYRVTIVNTTTVPVTSALPWSLAEFETAPFEAIKDSLDVLLLLGGQLGPEPSAQLRARGVKLVGYKCGSEAVISAENIVHNLPVTAGPYYNQYLNALWLIPQVAELNEEYYKVLHRCARSTVIPFVWDSTPLEQACETLPNAGLYTPGTQKARRLTTLEPNRELLKTFLTPLLIAEQFYRQHPEAVDVFSICNILHRREHVELQGIIQATRLLADKKLTLEGRHQTPWVLAHYTDVVISHQWGNPLNYAYLEASWLGYPLVHNATLCQDLGFYYPGFNVQAGVLALEQACQVGQAGGMTAEDYRRNQRQTMARFLATAPANVQAYDTLIASLFD